MSNVTEDTSDGDGSGNETETSTFRNTAPTLLVDLAVVLAWIAAMTLLFRTAGWSLTLYYVVVFVGVLAYSLAIDPWRRIGRAVGQDS